MINTARRHTVRDAWRLAKHYWTSEEKWSAWGLLLAVSALNLGNIYISVRIRDRAKVLLRKDAAHGTLPPGRRQKRESEAEETPLRRANQRPTSNGGFHGRRIRSSPAWVGLGSPPQLFEACRIGRRVLDGVLNVPVSEVILNEPRIRALVGQSEAASVAQHVGMGEQGQGSGGAVCPQEEIDRRTVQRLPLLADKTMF
jgi:hypothetical protein